MADGSIRVSTKLDNSEAEKDLESLEQMCDRTARNIENTSVQLGINSKGVNFISVNSEKSLEKAKARLEYIKKQITDIENETNKDLEFAVTDEQTVKLLELEEQMTESLKAEYEQLTQEVNNYNLAKQNAAQSKLDKENFGSASNALNLENTNTAFISGISSLEQYNAALNQTRLRMAQIRQSAAAIATEKGIDVESLLNANSEYRKLDERLKLLIQHQGDFKSTANNSFSGASKAANKLSGAIQNGIKKMARYTLAIFGARSAFMAVKQIMSSYIADNEALTNSIAGIKGALGEMLAPAIQRVINLASMALAYINAFVKALTGIDYVARYNAKALDKQTSSTYSLAKAQSQQRQSASFDEQTKLSDNSSSSGSGGGSDTSSSAGLELPILSEETLQKIQDFADKLKDVWEWVKKNKEELINVAAAVGTAFAVMALANWISKLQESGNLLATFPDKLKLVAGALLIGGGAYLITDAIKDIIENGPTLKNVCELIAGALGVVSGVFILLNTEMGKNLALQLKSIAKSAIQYSMYGVEGVKMLLLNAKAWVANNAAMLKTIATVALITAGIALIIAGVSDFIENGPTLKNTILIIGGAIAVAVGLATAGLSVLVAAIVGAVAAVTAFTIAILAEKPAIKTVTEAQEDLNAAKEEAAEAENNYIDAVDASESSLKKLKEAEEKAGISGEELFEKVQSGTLDYADMTDAQKEVYKAYLDNEQKQKDLKDTTDALQKAKEKETIASFENQLALAKESGSYDEYKKSVIAAYKNGQLSAEQARELIGKSMSEMSSDAQQTFMKDLPSDIKNGLDPKQYMTTRQKIKNWFSDTWKQCKEVFKNVGSWFKDKFSDAWSKIKGCFSGVGAFFSGVWKTIKEKFTTIGTTVGNAMSGAFKTVVNSILSFAERTINGFIRAINTAIGVINKIPGVKISTLNELSIPRLAKGGIVNNPGRGVTAVVGESGAEAVLPLEKNTEWMDVLAEKISGGTVTVPVYLDSKLIARYVIDRQKKQAFATNGGVL